MQIGKAIYKTLSEYLDIAFIVKFVILLAGLYSFNLFYVGVTDPRGRLYSAFLTRYLDYISWIRLSVLHTADLIVHQFGFASDVADAYTIRIAKGVGVIMGWPCIGLGIMSFWIAFMVTQDSRWQKKLLWSIGGLAAIWLMNCWRIALLLIALNQKWKVHNYNQHELFNLCCYCLIMVMIYAYYQRNKKETVGKKKVRVTALQLQQV